MTIGALPHMAAGRPVGLTGMASRLVAVACVAFAFRPLTGVQLIVDRWWLARARDDRPGDIRVPRRRGNRGR